MNYLFLHKPKLSPLFNQDNCDKAADSRTQATLQLYTLIKEESKATSFLLARFFMIISYLSLTF